MTVTSDFNSTSYITGSQGLHLSALRENKVVEMITFYVYIRTWSHTNVSKQWWCNATNNKTKTKTSVNLSQSYMK